MSREDDQAEDLDLLEPAPPTQDVSRPPTPFDDIDFVVTKEHRRFAEFADAVRRDRYIGLCHGPPGVGKTLSARHYSHWDEVNYRIERWRAHVTTGKDQPDWSTLLYTPTVNVTPRIIDKELQELSIRLALIRAAHPTDEHVRSDPHSSSPLIELLIVDEADRLKMPALEQLRDHYDRSRLGLILIGMPGIEKRLARYPQLYLRSADNGSLGGTDRAKMQVRGLRPSGNRENP
jgi:DNA transposition AAA+ family ATPase